MRAAFDPEAAIAVAMRTAAPIMSSRLLRVHGLEIAHPWMRPTITMPLNSGEMTALTRRPSGSGTPRCLRLVRRPDFLLQDRRIGLAAGAVL